jgi:transposase
MQPLFTQLLKLDGITVEDYDDLGEELVLTVEAETNSAICPRCGQTSKNTHENHYHLARDLNFGERQVWLKYNRRQFKCRECKKPFSEKLEFIGERRRTTDRFGEMIVKQVIHSDTHNVAKNHGLTDDEVWSMVEYVSQKKWLLELSGLKRLGIDEIAMKKGQGNYITVLVDLDKKELIDVVKSRQHKDIKEVLKGWDSEVLSQIEEVSIDMSGNYRSLVEKMLPNAEIVADRFHVTKLLGDELNRARNQEKKAINQLEDQDKQEKLKAVLSNSKYALLKPEKNLTDTQKLKLDEIKKALPRLAEMHQQKEALRDIFETAKSGTDGMLKIAAWMKKSQEIFKDSVGTIGRWFGEITNYFESRTTSGAVEGINNKLKLIKRSGYGFRNFDNFRLRCLICWRLSIS